MIDIISNLLGSINYDSMDELMVQLMLMCISGWILVLLFTQIINLLYYIFKLIFN